jgi:two-component system nitrate/nitrite response regulator NarL
VSNKHVDSPVVAAVIARQRLFRDGVEYILRDRGFAMHYSAASVQKLLIELHDGVPPDVLVLIGALPLSPDEMQALRAIREIAPNVRIIILAEDDCGSELLGRLVSIGVDALIPIDLSAEVLVEAILLVLLGEDFMFVEFVQRMLAVRELTMETPIPDLTKRELEIIRLVAEGRSNKIIADSLNSTEGAVKAEIRRLLRKLGAANRTQAAIWAAKMGLLSEADRSLKVANPMASNDPDRRVRDRRQGSRANRASLVRQGS